MSANRLTVACCITGSGAARRRPVVAPALVTSSPHAHCTVPAPKTSAPGGAWYIVRWCVCVVSVGDAAAVVGERLDAAHRRRGELELAARAGAVVGVDVPLVAERVAARRERPRLAGAEIGDRRVPPQAQVLVGRRDRDVRRTGVDDEQLAGERVLGRPPSAGGVNRGSRHVPVHATGSVGASKCVSLYEVSVRYCVAVPSALLGCQRVFQNTSLPLKNARLTPASRAASTFVRSRARPVLVVRRWRR